MQSVRLRNSTSASSVTIAPRRPPAGEQGAASHALQPGQLRPPRSRRTTRADCWPWPCRMRRVSAPHRLVGDTYTILLDGKILHCRYTLIDITSRRSGGPPPTRHDFEEIFTVLEGEVELTFRGERLMARAGRPSTFRQRPARLYQRLPPAGEAAVHVSPSGQRSFSSRSGSSEHPDRAAAQARPGAQAALSAKSHVPGLRTTCTELSAPAAKVYSGVRWPDHPRG